MTGPEVVAQVSDAHGIAYAALYRSVYSQLGEMKRAGRLVHEGRLWGQKG